MSNGNHRQVQAPEIPRSIRTAVYMANGAMYHLDQEPGEVVQALEALRLGAEEFARFTGDHREVYLARLVTEPQLGQMPNAMAVVAVMEFGRVRVAESV
jgi:hypothetical protein